MSSLIRVVTDEKTKKENKDFQLSIPDKFNNNSATKE